MSVPRIILSLFVVAILMVMCAQPTHSAGRPPKPCVGVVERTAMGVEYVRRRDGTACTRPAQARPTATARRVAR